jgi:peptidoglycan/xylan/chitin deacetylase (PgdA/CDA1 family)
MLKKIFKITIGFFGVALLFALIFYHSGYRYVAPIMMYHHVDDTHIDQANYVTPQRFEEHLRFLKENKYNVVSLGELVRLIKQKAPIPHKTVAITFDDGYANNYHHAYPLLKKYNFPATIFVPSDSIGQKGRLSLDQIKEMHKHNITIGSHTRHEAYLPDQDAQTLDGEIRQSKSLLENMLQAEVVFLAYPTGGFTDEVKAMTRTAGYTAACTTNRGYDKSNQDVFELNRIRFSNADNSPVILWAKLSGYYNMFRDCKHPN